MKKYFPPIIVFALSLMFLTIPAATAARAQPKCYWASDMSRAFCAPPFGDIIRDRNREIYYCGLGQCVINSQNEYRCSSVTGGAAVTDSRNRTACVGGCVPASESLCVRPEP